MKKSLGFTLIEILVVVSIIGILAALLLANMVGIRERAADTRSKQNLAQFKTALRLYYNDNQGYPASLSPSGCVGLFADDTYIKEEAIPNNCSYVSSNTDSFRAYVLLENTEDPQIAESQTKCGGAVAGSYYVCSD